MTIYLADRGKAAPVPDRQPSPLNLSSNNPFRKRGTSPSPQNAAGAVVGAGAGVPSLQSASAASGMSKNPFLDASEMGSSLLDKPVTDGAPPPPADPRLPRQAPTFPRTAPLSGHGPNAVSDEGRPAPRAPHGPDSPSKRREPRSQRPRGLSESSAIDERQRTERRDREAGEPPDRTESEERRRRERRREREERHRQRRETEKTRTGERKFKRPQGLDIIDKLDVTGIYGQGLFHHDGPFDACNPHRNAKKTGRPAPMQAFPADSANMALGGSGPLRSKIDLDRFHGRGEEGFSDYAVTKKADTAIVDPREREQIHGDESYGLGTSTFLEGAPASKSALQRRESQEIGLVENNGSKMGGGLMRKKSLAQRFRGMSASRGKMGPHESVRSPDARYNEASLLDSPPPAGPGARVAISAGGPARTKYTRENEVNPFDQNYDDAFDKQGAQIKIAEAEKPSAGGVSSPPVVNGLTRSMTADAAAIHARDNSNEENRLQPPQQSGNSGGGFLSRMKSLKGPRKTRPERRDP